MPFMPIGAYSDLEAHAEALLGEIPGEEILEWWQQYTAAAEAERANRHQDSVGAVLSRLAVAWAKP
jgi:hypothetical protein